MGNRLKKMLGVDDAPNEETPEEVNDTPPEETPEVATPKVEIKGKNVVVEDESGNEVRTYSEEQHGKEFLALAKMFIGKPKNAARGFRLRK